MFKLNRHPSHAQRLLTAVVGFIFLCTTLAAGLPVCKCGILCLHGGAEPESPVPVSQMPQKAGTQKAHGCCESVESSEKVPETGDMTDAHQGGDARCACPTELGASENEMPPAWVVGSQANSSNFKNLESGAFATLGTLSIPQISSRALLAMPPPRGSPTLRLPLYQLYAVYLI